ncbi:MAG: YceI family protein [Acidobacteriota bacterium]|nr:YceI family protein [Acidobacteriota bacterium]
MCAGRSAIWLLALALAVALAVPVSAAERVATFDPAASKISFVLQATAHQVEGTFPVHSGELRWDGETGVASGEIVVGAEGGQTGNDKRDAKMHSEVLESALFPSFTFRVERLEGDVASEGSSTVRLAGTLAIHGGEHSLTVDAEVEAAGGRFDAVASFPVPYVEWGLEDPSVFVLRVAKSVAVTVELAGTLSTAEPATGADG